MSEIAKDSFAQSFGVDTRQVVRSSSVTSSRTCRESV
jgi:hypothetical protein